MGEKIIFNSRKEALSYIKNKYNITFSRKVEQEMLHNRIPYVSFKKDVLPNTGDFVTFVFPYVRSNFEVDGEYEDALSGEKAGTKFFFSYSVLDLPKENNSSIYLSILN